MKESSDLTNSAINTLRFLSADGVQLANSGHPGLPMGCAAIAYTIWTRHLKHNPVNPHWPDRDRFILSGGHGSMLLYSLLYLTGYDVSLEDLKSFRQWGSKTPGHPEYGVTSGVETTTGPLGQGFTNAIGMAFAEEHLAAEFNKPDFKVIDHYTYAIVTDGDLMEGVTSEAASLAGHQSLGKLIFCYDDNRITIDGSTDLAFTEDRGKRFEAYGWQVIRVSDGNNVEEIDNTINAAKSDTRPSLIICRTHIGFGLPTRQDTSKAHGEPPGDEELNGAKQALGWPIEPRFYVPEDVLKFYRKAVEQGIALENQWQSNLNHYKGTYPELGGELERRLSGKLPDGWEKGIPEFIMDAKGIATRAASKKVINELSKVIPEFMGGSADLAPSTLTWIEGSPSFQVQNRAGKNFNFGVREHAMGAVVNGMALHGGIIP
jgi:transketolase